MPARTTKEASKRLASGVHPPQGHPSRDETLVPRRVASCALARRARRPLYHIVAHCTDRHLLLNPCGTDELGKDGQCMQYRCNDAVAPRTVMHVLRVPSVLQCTPSGR